MLNVDLYTDETLKIIIYGQSVAISALIVALIWVAKQLLNCWSMQKEQIKLHIEAGNMMKDFAVKLMDKSND